MKNLEIVDDLTKEIIPTDDCLMFGQSHVLKADEWHHDDIATRDYMRVRPRKDALRSLLSAATGGIRTVYPEAMGDWFALVVVDSPSGAYATQQWRPIRVNPLTDVDGASLRPV